MSLLTSSSQTVGPYVRIGFERFSIENLAPSGVSGERITLSGRITDADGAPVNDGIVEIWQANAHGKYAHPEDAQDKPVEGLFRGFGRSLTDANGGYRFSTIKPGRVPGPDRVPQAIRPIYTVNPMAHLVDLFRRCVLGSSAPDVTSVAVLAAIGVIALVLAQRIFSVFDGVLADVI